MNLSTALSLALATAFVTPPVCGQACNPNIRRSAPDSRFVVDKNQGTVLDKQTGLTWDRCVYGRWGDDCEHGYQQLLTWSSALEISAYKDWRLPNIKELESLIEVACYQPALNATVFPNDPGYWIWSSSPYADNADKAGNAWFVLFSLGNPNYGSRYGYNAVRRVRGGQ